MFLGVKTRRAIIKHCLLHNMTLKYISNIMNFKNMKYIHVYKFNTEWNNITKRIK
jgi:hypothetical protein